MEPRRILIVGVGGLGVPAAIALARAGVATLALCDPDPVELSNLARQVIFRPSDIGCAKVEAAARRLRENSPGLDIETHLSRFDAGTAPTLIARAALVIDATDDPQTKFLINDICVAARRPFVHAGVLAMRGQLMTVIPAQSACLRCLFEEAPDDADAASCRDAGIIGPVAAAIGELQAAEAIRLLAGRAPRFSGAILTYDAAAAPPRVRVVAVPARRGCNCGAWSEGGAVRAGARD